MRPFAGKRYWLIGASEGLGAALAEALSRAGAEVILSARNEARLQTVASGLPGPSQCQLVDVTEVESVRRAADAIGPVDGLVYLAAVYWPMPAVNWQAEKATAMADVNFTGALRVLGAVVPDMVARNSGHIVITGSLGGFRGLPGAIGYAASKAGVMSLAESMYYDLRKTGVDVQLVNAGYIRTRLSDKNTIPMPFIMEPEVAADRMLDHMRSTQFSISFPTVFSWLFRIS
ncbi:MAG: SDR family NAD(P)-dependent oxidoreductase, partial [Paracoccaceae bacterium]|nr:SDR family NAD(P)-dependent oxidoreductase [Paracoccaceae bacterium]